MIAVSGTSARSADGPPPGIAKEIVEAKAAAFAASIASRSEQSKAPQMPSSAVVRPVDLSAVVTVAHAENSEVSLVAWLVAVAVIAWPTAGSR